ncbi:MAG: hydrogenase/urease maturation nickel metallochaperone HypA [Candidatus Omnitrophica bacterium]|nr:hydrogenase/urease maturation nickel metallochaperone HypA [Candidatus Omnitrophota bacterium]
MKDIFEDLLRLGREQNAKKITKVYLKMGDFTEINEDVLKFFFEEKGKGTILEGARIEIEKSPMRELRLVSFDCE